jgi:predicted anti-sigma-YlaC factor YlaD
MARMSEPAGGEGAASPPTGARPGRRWAIASLLMVPALFVLYVPLYFVGWAFQSALGLAEDELLAEAGPRGVAAAVLMLALTAVPQIVGVVLGVKARRLGEVSLGTTGIVVNAVLGGFFMLSGVANMLLG